MPHCQTMQHFEINSSHKIDFSAVNAWDVFSTFNYHEQLSFSSHDIENSLFKS